MEKEKKGKGLIGLVVLLFIIVLGLVGYICYDKGVFDGLLGKEPSETNKISEEEVKKLHDSLIAKSDQYGFYFNRKVSIDEMPAEYLLQFVIANYLDENNISYDLNNYYMVCGDYSDEYYFCNYDDESENPKEINNDITKKMTISKDIIDSYIKQYFNTDRNVVFGDRISIQTSKHLGLDVYYNSKKKEYYVVVPHRGGSSQNIGSKMLKYEQNGDELYIYDNAVICYIENGGGCYNTIYLNYTESSNDSSLFYWNSTDNVRDKNDKKIDGGTKYLGKWNESKRTYDFNYDLIFEDFASEINTYKHTFKKGVDGKYYWYSSEIVK